jgi:hypothetical protein
MFQLRARAVITLGMRHQQITFNILLLSASASQTCQECLRLRVGGSTVEMHNSLSFAQKIPQTISSIFWLSRQSCPSFNQDHGVLNTCNRAASQGSAADARKKERKKALICHMSGMEIYEAWCCRRFATFGHVRRGHQKSCLVFYS